MSYNCTLLPLLQCSGYAIELKQTQTQKNWNLPPLLCCLHRNYIYTPVQVLNKIESEGQMEHTSIPSNPQKQSLLFGIISNGV